MDDAVSFSSHLSPAAWLGGCFVFGIRNYPLGWGFCSSGWHAHSPLDFFHSPNFVQVQGQENYPVVGTLWVLSIGDLVGVGFPGVDLILPCLTVALTNTQVLPTDDVNCRSTIWGPSPKYMES